MKIIVVGGVALGASAAARSRRLDEEAQIVMFERGPFVSFSNCCLPNHLSGQIETWEELVLLSPEILGAFFNIDARVNSEVIRIDKENKQVIVKNNITNEEYTEGYDKLVIGSGADAFVPPFEGLDKIDHFSLKTVPDAKGIVDFINAKKPKHITVVGGGFIGLEAAENLRHIGIEVTLVEGLKSIIPFVDEEISFFGQKEMVENGVEIIVNDLVEKFDTKKVYLKSGKIIESDGVIIAIGIRPATKWLEDSGMEMDRGFIIVNDNYQTSIPDVYAGGDAILVKNGITNEPQQLSMAGPANKQGRLIADHMFGRKFVNKGYLGTGVVKLFNMNIACTGLREKDMDKYDYDYDVVYAGPPGIVGIMPGSHAVFSKLIYNKKDGKVLGAQFASTGAADKRTDVIATAIKAEMTVYDLYDLELAYAPAFGTGKDVINKIGYIATNLMEGLAKQVRFSDVYDLLKRDAQIIDVREPLEYKGGHIKGVKNIQMSQFRNRLDEFDKSKPVYICCLTGERSYSMALALKHYGFDAFNIAGGWDFLLNYEQTMQYNYSDRENILTGTQSLNCKGHVN